MAHSFAQQASITCQTCGQPFAPDVWLILHAAERPDLLARARDGALHRFACPNGHAAEVDAPLLIFRPDEARPLLFSPAQGTTAEQDRQMAAGLLGRLAESLGDAWRDDWLAGVSLIPRAALPAVLAGADPEAAAAAALEESVPPAVAAVLQEIAAALAAEGVVLESPADLERALATRPALRAKLAAAMNEAAPATTAPASTPSPPAPADPDDPLPAALQAFVQADSWFASYRFVRAHPELLSAAAEKQLAELIAAALGDGDRDAATVFHEHLALLQRARAVGAAAAFAEKLEATAAELEAAAEAEDEMAAISPGVRQALDEIIAALEAEGVTPASPEDLERALATRPALAARLEAAAREAGATPEAAGATPAVAPDPLPAALQTFVQAETWFASYQHVRDHPELLSDAAEERLAGLVEQATAAGNEPVARVFAEHLALLRRARAVGAAQAFAEKMGTTADELEAAAEGAAAAAAIPPQAQQVLQEIVAALEAEGVSIRSPEELQAALATRPELAARLAAALGGAAGDDRPDVPERYRADVGRAGAAGERYRRTGDRAALDEAAAAWARVLDDPGFPAAPERFQLAALNDAAIVFIRRYQAGGHLPDLDRALALWNDALARTPADSPDRAGRLNNLGSGLRDRYARTGRAADLDAAIAAWEDAVRRTPADSPDRAMYLNNLGNGLRDRYARTGRAADLDAAIAAYEDAVRRTPADSPDRAGRLNNLGLGLRDRYARTGRAADLDAAIAAWEDAVRRTPADSPDRAGRLNNLGNGLRARYARTGRAADLDAAIAAYEDAVRRTPADSPDRAGRLNNLGLGLRDRYARTGRAADLDAAIAAYEDAVRRTPADSPDRAAILNNLGNGLSDRYARTGRAADLDAAIAAYEDAVRRTPADSPDQAAILNNLGGGLRDRYARTGRAADLDAAIAAWEDAVRRTPADSPDRAGRLNNLGNGLRDRYARTGRAADLDAAIAAWEDAVRRTPADSPDRAGYLTNLGAGLRDRYARTGRAADLDAAIAAYEDAVRRTPADSPDRAGRLNNLGNGLRDRYARTGRAADLDAAIAVWEDAIATLDRALVDSPVAFVLGQQAEWAGLYARTVDALATAGRPAGALAVAEGSKSRLLAGLVGRGELPAPDEVPAALAARERALAGQLNALDTTELAGRGAAPPVETSGDGRAVARRAAVVAELRAAWEEMAAAGPAAVEYVAARRGDRLSAGDLARLAGALPPGAALLSLFTTGGRTLLFLWPAGQGAPLMLDAAIAPDALRYDFLANYEEEVLRRADLRELGRPLTHHWRALGPPLLGPLRPHLAGVDHLIIAPESVYHQLPLHALWLSDAGDTLLDHCAVSYVPALGVLERLRRREPAGGGAAVFGYTNADGATESGRAERDIFLGEAALVAQFMGVAPVLDDAANGAALEPATAAPLRLLHLSCHGYFNTADALKSGVWLADGVYTARQFLRRRLAVELVTLSACQTGVSRSLGGDEMAGLSLALLTAGARSLLLGLWSVNAATTAALMVDFYARLWPQQLWPQRLGPGGGAADSMDKAQALRQTMLALRDGRLISPRPGFDPGDPFYWAPFVLQGDWR